MLCLFICLLPLKNRTSLQLRLTCLGASKKNLLLSKSLANLLIFLIFWLAQYVLLAGAVFLYTKQPAYTGGPQGPLVIYHNSGLLSLFSSRFTYLPLGWYVFSLIAIAIITALINLSYLEKGRFKSLLGLLLLLPIFFVASSLDKRHAFICIGYTIVLCIITVFFYLHPYKSSKHSSIENIDLIEKLEGIGSEDTK